MTRTPTTFWEHVYHLRARKKIPRVWRTKQLTDFLGQPRGAYSPNTIAVNPYNSSIERVGNKMGDFVKRGGVPKVWRVGRGQFQLIADPEDDPQTQETERTRAIKRAEELRSPEWRANDDKEIKKAPASRLDHTPVQPSVQSERDPDADLYPSVPITLTESERQTLAGRIAEDKALYIVHKHLTGKYEGRAVIEEDRDGADLRVSIDGKTERIEVKGTESPTIAWPELEVSSQDSHDALKDGDASIYRVVDAAGTNPRIYILTYGQHFTLEPEPKWVAKRVTAKDDRYPLRGEPYRYDLPFDPVAADEWEVLE